MTIPKSWLLRKARVVKQDQKLFCENYVGIIFDCGTFLKLIFWTRDNSRLVKSVDFGGNDDDVLDDEDDQITWRKDVISSSPITSVIQTSSTTSHDSSPSTTSTFSSDEKHPGDYSHEQETKLKNKTIKTTSSVHQTTSLRRAKDNLTTSNRALDRRSILEVSQTRRRTSDDHLSTC